MLNDAFVDSGDDWLNEITNVVSMSLGLLLKVFTHAINSPTFTAGATFSVANFRMMYRSSYNGIVSQIYCSCIQIYESVSFDACVVE